MCQHEMLCALQMGIFMRLASKFYWRLTNVSRSVGETYKATFGSVPLSIACSSRMHPHRKPRYDRLATWPPRKICEVILAACTHARMHARTHVLCRCYHVAACFTYSHFFPLLFYFSFLFEAQMDFMSRVHWTVASPPDAIYLIVKIGNTRRPCNVMKIARYTLSFCLFFPLLEYYVTRGERPRYSHARYEMQRLAKQTRWKIRE